MDTDEKVVALRKGLLEFVILKVVSADKVYVADILKRLTGTNFATQEGTLSPMLSRMRREQLVDYDWQESSAGPPRKYYTLTQRGRKQLAALNSYWQELGAQLSQFEK